MTTECPACNEKVFFAERVTSFGRDYHRTCLKCEKCSKILAPGQHAAHAGKNYCDRPCYMTLYAPKAFGYGGLNNCLPEANGSAASAASE